MQLPLIKFLFLFWKKEIFTRTQFAKLWLFLFFSECFADLIYPVDSVIIDFHIEDQILWKIYIHIYSAANRDGDSCLLNT